jgi:hypothetical protein
MSAVRVTLGRLAVATGRDVGDEEPVAVGCGPDEVHPTTATRRVGTTS